MNGPVTGPTDEHDAARAATGSLPGTLVAAVALALLEAMALLVVAVVVVVKTVAGHPTDVGGALLAAVLALVGAAVLAAGARGLVRRQAGARTPVLVLQLLALPVAYSLWIQAGVVAYGAPLAVVALALLYLLFAPPTRAALEAPGPADRADRPTG